MMCSKICSILCNFLLCCAANRRCRRGLSAERGCRSRRSGAPLPHSKVPFSHLLHSFEVGHYLSPFSLPRYSLTVLYSAWISYIEKALLSQGRENIGVKWFFRDTHGRVNCWDPFFAESTSQGAGDVGGLRKDWDLFLIMGQCLLQFYFEGIFKSWMKTSLNWYMITYIRWFRGKFSLLRMKSKIVWF